MIRLPIYIDEMADEATFAAAAVAAAEAAKNRYPGYTVVDFTPESMTHMWSLVLKPKADYQMDEGL